jgi:hypothetical protein
LTKRLWFIIAFGVIAIPLAYYVNNPPQDTASSETAAYEKQLEAIKEKQRTNTANADKTETSSSQSSQTATFNTDAAAGLNSTTPNTNSVSTTTVPTQTTTPNFQSTLQHLQRMMPSAKLPVANYDSNNQRLQYLQTMPVTIIEATSKQDALILARQDAGRPDPFGPLSNSQPFPKQKSNSKSSSLEKLAGTKVGSGAETGPEGLPPPPTADASPSLAASLTPPPPPLPTPGISLEELPPPPDRPLLSKRLKLNAILGDHVILAFKDRRFQKQNHFKQYITLSQGQEFDTVTLVDIGKDKAVLEEHGRQITMELDPIR